jgi:light-regulated signal transduction histidine kinase (bacteriophytochrome)
MFSHIVEHSMKFNRLEHPAIEITIGTNDDAFVIRFRDQGGGITTQSINCLNRSKKNF